MISPEAEKHNVMTRDVSSGALLIGGALASVVVMVLHPTGHGLMNPETAERMGRLNVLVHGLALAATPVVFLGLLGLARRLGPAPVTTAALVAWGFGAVAILGAAVASGFVAPGVIAHIVGTQESRVPEAFLLYTGLWNQGFAKVAVTASSVSMLLWAWAVLRTRRIPPGSGFAGLAVGLVVLLGLLIGHLRLDIHGFGLVTFAQSAWLTWTGVELCRIPREALNSP